MSFYNKMMENILIQRVLKNIDIEYLLEYLGLEYDDRGGGELYCQCPNPDHLDENPSWSINKYSGNHNCFSCGYGGNIINLVSTTKDISYEDAKEWLRDFIKDNINIDDDVFYENAIKEKEENESNDEVIQIKLPKYFEKIKIDKNDRFYKYLKSRHISDKLIKFIGIGKCISGFYSNRIIIPIYFNGELYSFFARSILKHIDKKAKGLYPKGPKMGKILWPFYGDFIDLSYKKFYIVEGSLDVLRLRSLGMKNVFCSFGNKISETQVELLENVFDKSYDAILIPDGDGEIIETNKGFEFTKGKLMLYYAHKNLKYKYNTYKVKLPKNTDPGDVGIKSLKRALKNKSKLTEESKIVVAVNYKINK